MGYNMMRSEVFSESKMQILGSMTSEQFCALPEETEVLFFKIAPFGTGVSIEGVNANPENKESIRKHAVDEHGGQEYTLPFDLVVYLLPEDFVPDPSEILAKRFIDLGTRHGREGAIMLSEDGLKRYAGDEWNDGAYDAYVKAYKGAKR